MLTIVLLVSLTTVGWTLWVRRDCWYSKWEYAANTAIALQAVGLILLVPDNSELLCSWLYRITDYGDYDDILGQSLFVWSAAAICYHVATRVRGAAARVKRLVLASVIPLAVLRFMLAVAGQYCWYWFVACGSTIAYLLVAGWMMGRVLWDDPRHRPVIVLLAVAAALGVGTCTAAIVKGFDGSLTIELNSSIWLGCAIATTGWAVAFHYSWKRRQREMAVTYPVPIHQA